MVNFFKKNIKSEKPKFPSELRMDFASKDWVVIATGRARRPETFKKEKRKKEKFSKKNCPFCLIENQKNALLVFSKGKKIFQRDWDMAYNPSKISEKEIKKWTTIVVPNKYPAFIQDTKLSKYRKGSYEIMNALGYHEVIITKSHKKSLGELSIKEIKEVLDVYQERYLKLKDKKFVNYISVFHNHGREAGASIVHSHSQILTVPLIDHDLRGALLSAKRYFKKNKKCVYCEMNKWEMKEKERIVFENKSFAVICPFASKTAFETIISPKKHLAYFEKITESQKQDLAEAFKAALGKLYKALNNPPYNFYLHSAPSDNGKYGYYHWHWTILPRTSIWAGFELGAKIEISTIEPEKAAEYLRKH